MSAIEGPSVAPAIRMGRKGYGLGREENREGLHIWCVSLHPYKLYDKRTEIATHLIPIDVKIEINRHPFLTSAIRL